MTDVAAWARRFPVDRYGVDATGHGWAGWLWSLGILLAVYFGLSRFLRTGKNLAARTYRFAE